MSSCQFSLDLYPAAISTIVLAQGLTQAMYHIHVRGRENGGLGWELSITKDREDDKKNGAVFIVPNIDHYFLDCT